jgi:NitT/TauT family transport system substrate-binding protein
MRKFSLVPAAAAVFICFFLLAGCGKEDSPEKNEPEKIRIGLMPDAGALPLLLMEDVEAVPFFSARERDTAMQLGELDGMMGDLVGMLTFTSKDIPLKILTITESRFLLVGAPGTEESLEDETAPWRVGVSENSVIEYMVDHWAQGRPVEKVAIPQVPVRMEMLAQGQIPLACLTDAMAWPLLARDFPIIRDQRDGDEEPGILLLSEAFLDSKDVDLNRFRKGWNDAVAEINRNPEKYRDLLEETARIPLIEDHPYPMPVFRPVTLPTEAQFNSVLSWFREKFNWTGEILYEDLILDQD